MPIKIEYQDLDSIVVSGGTEQETDAFAKMYGKFGEVMGTVKDAMMEVRNKVKDVKHWKQELRNAMYQLHDDELILLFRECQMEADRLRMLLQIEEDTEPNGDEPEIAEKET